MSRENVERVYAAFDAIERQDVDALLAHLSPDVTITPLSAELEGAVHHGHEGARVWLSNLLSVFSGYGPRIEGIRDLGDSSLITLQQQGEGRGSHAPIIGRVWVVVQWSGDKAIAWRSYRDEQAALEAVGLREQAMSRENVEVVRSVFEAVASRDGEALEALGLREQAMSQENVEVVRQVFDATARRDLRAVLDLYDPEVVLDFTQGAPPTPDRRRCPSRA